MLWEQTTVTLNFSNSFSGFKTYAWGSSDLYPSIVTKLMWKIKCKVNCVLNNETSSYIISDMEPVGLAVDWVFEHLYWTDTSYRAVMMSSFCISDMEPVGLAVDWVFEHLYWTDTSYRAWWCHVFLYIISDMEPVGLAVDWVFEHLYWTDTSYRAVMMSNLDGSGRVTLAMDDLSIPRGIAVDPKNM